MHATIGKRASAGSAAAANDNGRTHPAWRRAVAGEMAAVFALTLALFGLMLCIAPAVEP